MFKRHGQTITTATDGRDRAGVVATLTGVSRIFTVSFSSVYPHYVTKAEKKGRTKAELDQVIRWLTGFERVDVERPPRRGTTFEDFFAAARLNPEGRVDHRGRVWLRVESIDDPLMQKIRYLDKLVASSPRESRWTRSCGPDVHAPALSAGHATEPAPTENRGGLVESLLVAQQGSSAVSRRAHQARCSNGNGSHVWAHCG